MAERKKILWPTELSQSCSTILPRLCEMAQKYDDEIEVLYIGDDLADVVPFYGYAGEEHTEKYNEWEIERCMKRLDESCGPEPDKCPPVTKKVVLGDAYYEIMKAIDTDNVEMVFFAAKCSGAEEGQRLQFGGVADKVKKNSPVPVKTIDSCVN